MCFLLDRVVGVSYLESRDQLAATHQKYPDNVDANALDGPREEGMCHVWSLLLVPG